MSSSADVRTRYRPRVAGERGRARTTTRRNTRVDSPTLRHTEGKANHHGESPEAGRRLGWKAATRHAEAVARATAAGGLRRWAAPVAALVTSLAVLGVLLGLALRDPGAQARVERAAASQARTSVEQMLSYNYKAIDDQSARIETLLTGSFKKEFTDAMDKDIKPLAVKNQTVVQARVSDIGVMSSSPTSVKVLAFVNQARVGADQKDPAVDQNRVIATMTKVGDRWLVSKVDAF